jgi:hypothetical protein
MDESYRFREPSDEKTSDEPEAPGLRRYMQYLRNIGEQRSEAYRRGGQEGADTIQQSRLQLQFKILFNIVWKLYRNKETELKGGSQLELEGCIHKRNNDRIDFQYDKSKERGRTIVQPVNFGSTVFISFALSYIGVQVYAAKSNGAMHFILMQL